MVERLQATRQHPFFVEGKGFVPAGGLAIGNAIVTRAGPTLTVKSIQWQRRAEGWTVYNFEVESGKGEDTHNYFAGKKYGGIWVHNGPCSIDFENLDLEALLGKSGLFPGTQSKVYAGLLEKYHGMGPTSGMGPIDVQLDGIIIEGRHRAIVAAIRGELDQLKRNPIGVADVNPQAPGRWADLPIVPGVPTPHPAHLNPIPPPFPH